ncbi:hypothetical protein VNI00_019284 [Paramarasmius palmivorus]|uniref:Uncharacterized protein n=1 Tax=Paramarasmius palmivorus TaxID=297713 RepID=A0AAW0API9_9AGAR
MRSQRSSRRLSLKTILLFPVSDEPELVTLERQKVDARDFRPYMQASERRSIQNIRVQTDCCTIYFIEQTARNDFQENVSVTRELEAEGLMRPWLGPIIVVWDQDDALTSDNWTEKCNEVIVHLSSVYEAVERDGSIEYEGMEEEDEGEEE